MPYGDYEGAVQGLITPSSAVGFGKEVADTAAAGAGINDVGAQIQQRVAQTQIMRQQLQQKMQENHDAMVNHVGQGMYQLADADDDEKKGPVWKMQKDELLKKMQSLGVQANPDVVDAYLKDPDHSGKLTSAMGQMFSDPSADPHVTAEALRTLGNNFGSMEEAVKAPDELLGKWAQVKASQMKMGNTYQTRADKIRDQVKGINQKWDINDQFADNALSILNNKDLVNTGQGITQLQEAVTRAQSGGAIRSFTLQLGQDNRSLANKFMGVIDKAATGAKLQPDELQAMKQGLQLAQSNSNKYRDQEVQPYYHGAKAIVNGSQLAGYNIEPNQMIPDDQWDRFENPAPVKRSSNISIGNKTSSGLDNYSPGDSGNIDAFLKSTILSGASYQQVNKLLSRKNLKISQDDYEKFKGQ